MARATCSYSSMMKARIEKHDGAVPHRTSTGPDLGLDLKRANRQPCSGTFPAGALCDMPGMSARS
jgi:hypothetical protein